MCEVLVVDEVSMISGELFDKIEFVARAVRRCERPFGGIQVILCGDFFQLPPVFDADEHEHRFCFEADCWSAVVPQSFMLRQIFRQRDSTFIDVLSEVRTGAISPRTVACLQACIRPPWEPSEGNEPTRLCLHALPLHTLSHVCCSRVRARAAVPHRAAVDAINARRLAMLGSDSQTYEAVDFVQAPVYQKMLAQVMAPQSLTLRIGAQVILLKNLVFERELVNGSTGTVVAFRESSSGGGGGGGVRARLPVVRFRNGEECTIDYAEWAFESGGVKVASRSQIPLNLAWALSIHKSQGMTLTNVEMSIDKVFAEGQAYVALSRVVSLAGLRIVGALPPLSAMRPNPRVVEFYRTFA